MSSLLSLPTPVLSCYVCILQEASLSIEQVFIGAEMSLAQRTRLGAFCGSNSPFARNNEHITLRFCWNRKHAEGKTSNLQNHINKFRRGKPPVSEQGIFATLTSWHKSLETIDAKIRGFRPNFTSIFHWFPPVCVHYPAACERDPPS